MDFGHREEAGTGGGHKDGLGNGLGKGLGNGAEGIGYDPDQWPPFRGDYVVGDPTGRVAVMTLASHLEVRGAVMCGPCKTENLGVEKVVANVISNSNIRFLLICGQESKGHLPGETMVALHENGIDESGRIVGSRGAIPFIENLSAEAVDRFRRQVKVVSMIGLEDPGEIERALNSCKDGAEPYPEPPFTVVRRRPRRSVDFEGDGDVDLGGSVVLDSLSWLVSYEGPLGIAGKGPV